MVKGCRGDRDLDEALNGQPRSPSIAVEPASRVRHLRFVLSRQPSRKGSRPRPGAIARCQQVARRLARRLARRDARPAARRSARPRRRPPRSRPTARPRLLDSRCMEWTGTLRARRTKRSVPLSRSLPPCDSRPDALLTPSSTSLPPSRHRTLVSRLSPRTPCRRHPPRPSSLRLDLSQVRRPLRLGTEEARTQTCRSSTATRRISCQLRRRRDRSLRVRMPSTEAAAPPRGLGAPASRAGAIEEMDKHRRAASLHTLHLICPPRRPSATPTSRSPLPTPTILGLTPPPTPRATARQAPRRPISRQRSRRPPPSPRPRTAPTRRRSGSSSNSSTARPACLGSRSLNNSSSSIRTLRPR